MAKVKVYVRDGVEAFVQDLSPADDVESVNTNDIWGAAIAWYGTEVGAEYNFCKEYTEDEVVNSSAIYSMRFEGDPDDPNSRITTDYDDYEHYEVDFRDPKWEKKLCDTMIDFVLKRCA